MFLQVVDSLCMPRLLVTSSIQDAIKCLWKHGVIKVKQCQRDRDGKGPSRLCPRALVAWQPMVHRLNPSHSVFCDMPEGQGRWPCDSWLLDTQEWEQQQQLGLLHTEQERVMARA